MVLVVNLDQTRDFCVLGQNPRVDPYEFEFHRLEN